MFSLTAFINSRIPAITVNAIEATLSLSSEKKYNIALKYIHIKNSDLLYPMRVTNLFLKIRAHENPMAKISK